MSLVQPDWPAPDNIVAFTTTRTTPDSSFADMLPRPSWPRIQQVHGAAVVDAQQVGDGVEADAIYTTRAGIPCAVVTADCLPILLCHADGREVAAVHAGWRGLAAGVIERVLAAMDSPANALLAWIGPGISQSCYEVGAEVREAFLVEAGGDIGPLEGCFEPRGNEKYLADLAAIARIKLRSRGVEGVYGGDICTYSDSARFHSWRRDGADAGRITSLICRLR